MSGQRGRSGGRNKVSFEEHLRRGTWRKDRHGTPVTFPEGALSEPDPAPPSWMPNADELASLDPAGVSWLTRLVASHDLTKIEGVLAIEAARCVGAIAALNAEIGADASTRPKLDRLRLAWSKQLATWLGMLRAPDDRRGGR